MVKKITTVLASKMDKPIGKSSRLYLSRLLGAPRCAIRPYTASVDRESTDLIVLYCNIVHG